MQSLAGQTVSLVVFTAHCPLANAASNDVQKSRLVHEMQDLVVRNGFPKNISSLIEAAVAVCKQ